MSSGRVGGATGVAAAGGPWKETHGQIHGKASKRSQERAEKAAAKEK